MNIPKSPRRHGSRLETHIGPDGDYRGGLHNENFATQLGIIVSYWVHVEEQMISFLGLLIGDDAPARQIFRGITAQNSRIRVMRALLQRAERNKEKDAEYDEIITEFASLNDKRNNYAHGLWTTHESGRVFLSEAMLEDGHFWEKREIPIEELKNSIIRMSNLWRRVLVLIDPVSAQRVPERPLLKIPLPPPAEETP